MLCYMPREVLTDEKVLRDCMDSYPIPMKAVDDLLSVGTFKTQENFRPFRARGKRIRIPALPQSQLVLAKTLATAKRNPASTKMELDKIRASVLAKVPNYPSFIREPLTLEEMMMIDKEIAEMDDDEELSQEIEDMIEAEVEELDDDDDDDGIEEKADEPSKGSLRGSMRSELR